MIDEMDLGLVTLHALYHGKEKKLNPGWMADELDKHGYEYDRTEVEHALRNLVAKGLMDTDEDRYWTSDKGEKFFSDMRDKLEQADKEILKD